MEAVGLAFAVAQTLLAALSYPPLQQIFTMWGYRSELESLSSTVSNVNAVLRDAQSVDEEKLSDCERNLIEKLKEAVYDADDLLDEFATLAQQQHQLCMEADEKSIKKEISSNGENAAKRSEDGTKRGKTAKLTKRAKRRRRPSHRTAKPS